MIRQAMKSYIHSHQLAEFIFARRGDFWEVKYEGSNTVYLKDSVGMKYLGRLLAEPHQSIPAVTLLAAVAGIDPLIPTGTSGGSMDIQTRENLRQRYSELMEDRENATQMHDFGALENLDIELEQLSVELARQLGKGGKIREYSDADRVRKSVSVALKRATAQIAKEIPSLGTHLDRAISSGLIFKYSPDREVDWEL